VIARCLFHDNSDGPFIRGEFNIDPAGNPRPGPTHRGWRARTSLAAVPSTTKPWRPLCRSVAWLDEAPGQESRCASMNPSAQPSSSPSRRHLERTGRVSSSSSSSSPTHSLDGPLCAVHASFHLVSSPRTAILRHRPARGSMVHIPEVMPMPVGTTSFATLRLPAIASGNRCCDPSSCVTDRDPCPLRRYISLLTDSGAAPEGGSCWIGG